MMKFAKATLVLFSAIAASTSASGGHLKATNNDDWEDAETMQRRDLALASRALWKASSYIQTCSCIADFTKELTAFQFQVLLGLDTLLYADSNYRDNGFVSGSITPPAHPSAGNDIINCINEVAAEASQKLIDSYECGCENAPEASSDDTERIGYYYRECCCDAEIVKDVYKNQMQAIADMPTGYWINGGGVGTDSDAPARDKWIAAMKAADDAVLGTLPTYTPAISAP